MLIADRERLDQLAPADGSPLAPTVVAIDDPAPGERSYAGLLEAGRSAPAPDVDATPDDIAWLIATSGTSGTPKVVQLTHRNLLAAVRTTRAVRTIGPDDAFLTPFPLCHVAGYNVLLFHNDARPVVVLRRFTKGRTARAGRPSSGHHRVAGTHDDPRHRRPPRRDR